MADFSPITRRRLTEVPLRAQTPITTLFSQMLAAATAHIVAERRIERLDLSDPAHAHWLREAEDAQSRMAGLLVEIQNTSLASPLDRPLVRMAMMLDALTGSEEPGSFQRLHTRAPEQVAFMRVPGGEPGAVAVQGLIDRAQRCIALMAELTLYSQEPLPDPLVADGGSLSFGEPESASS